MRKHYPYIHGKTSITPLLTFRVLFGALMFTSVVRFVSKGWVEQLYIEPQYFFTYLGFHWVQPLGPAGMYTVFGLMGLASLGIMLGWRYRLSVLLFFITFNYVELLDKSNYLNHYYFVSIISFLLFFLPANRKHSLDARRNPSILLDQVPAWTVNILKLQLGLVYFYAGAAKLNSFWMLEAMPLRIWLPAHAELPVIGPLLDETWVAYAFSWGGALYDLAIPFLLLVPATRVFAFCLVVGFHLMTAILFPIGMFPYIMIASTLVFFSPGFHDRLWEFTSSRFSITPGKEREYGGEWSVSPAYRRFTGTLLGLHFFIQLVLPWRYLLYPGNLFWTEEGYRFSWRVMLMEKAGYAQFIVTDPATGNSSAVDNSEFLRPHQEKMMATQPDMILQFAHFLESVYRTKGFEDVEVRVQSQVALNGRRSQIMIDPETDLSVEKYNLRKRNWIRPFNPEP